MIPDGLAPPDGFEWSGRCAQTRDQALLKYIALRRSLDEAAPDLPPRAANVALGRF